ncbi:MAG: single-stranded-DNA-specific exonuclease RecJ [Proteobacteria bacterium]|nr:single-stranded-DNA-specific exonuclease RecJ [Pseudomonadota bacterium]
MIKTWTYLKPDIRKVKTIQNALKCHEIIAKILVNRGIHQSANALSYINTSPLNMRDPFSLKDMMKAAERTAVAIKSREKILIFGDYDADGVTSITILHDFLVRCGSDVTFYIPHRMNEGYGLKAAHIRQFQSNLAPSLIITVDCGMASHDAALEVKKSEIDLIITDHHASGETIPEAFAIINPKQSECQSGLSHLAGVGVVFYFLMALRKHLRDINFFIDRPEPNLKQMCDLVAIGTMADMVPLIDENRIIVHTGLEVLRSRGRKGLQAIVSLSGINGDELTAEDIAFKIAPRLNSAGRIGHANIALNLLLETDDKQAMAIARQIEEMNAKRKELEDNIFDQVESYIDRHPNETYRSIVLSSNYWHLGVLGIVCSRLANKYYKPVILVSLDTAKGTGSGRSIPGLNLFKILSMCKNDLLQFGGHQMATGLTISPDKIQSFKYHFDQIIEENHAKEKLIPKLCIDAELDFSDITETLIDQIETLQPFGEENPEPVFSSRNILIQNTSDIGKHHKRFTLFQKNGKSDKKLNAICFNYSYPNSKNDKFDQIAYSIKWNRWKGQKTAQLVIADFKKISCNLLKE